MEIGMDLGTEGIAEDGGVGWTCWRSIGDQYLTRVEFQLDIRAELEQWK